MSSEANYYRPLVQCGAPMPSDAVVLAGGWVWATHVEILSRTAPPVLCPVSDIPTEAIERLTAPRDAVAGLVMDRPQLMGILNVTPDSFSDGGQFLDPMQSLAHANVMIADGADILDIGGESTRPGATYVTPQDEISRTAPVIAALRKDTQIPISIDTRKAPVAQAALEAGADLVNDVYAFTHDKALAKLCAKHRVPVCLMHAQGDPEVMQDNPSYDNILLDVYDFLEARVRVAVHAGIPRSQIIVDPGIGFGKTTAHNVAIMRGLSIFHGLGCPILLGASRKRFIGEIAGETDPLQRTAGSIAVALAGVAQGVQILRVHDIKETKQALALWQAVSSGEFEDGA